MLFCKVLTILLWFCRSKGFGFVTFTGSSGIDEIQKNRPHEIDAKKIETKRATPKQVCQFPDFEKAEAVAAFQFYGPF